MLRRYLTIVSCLSNCLLIAQAPGERYSEKPDSIATHKVVLDSSGKIISWIKPQSGAYDRFLKDRWNFIFRGIPLSPGPAPRSDYPQYYFYCAFKDQQMIPDTWMNDVGEKIPNWFESARLYYQYTGDPRAMDIVIKLIDYTIAHGTSPASFAWPGFPYTTANAGDTLFRGFTNAKKLVLYEIQVDHAADMGLAYYRLFLYTGNEKYRTAAIAVADVLAANARTGNAHQSVWPYRVVLDSGRITAEYGANWMGAYSLLTALTRANNGHPEKYKTAMVKARDFMLAFPMKTGYWTDGHTDTDINSYTYKSNMSASNMVLYLFDHPDFDPEYKSDIPKLIQWTETNFVFRNAPGEPSTQWGANIVGEQDEFLPKMDYQTARYGAECARWYAISEDQSFKERSYRALNWVTYCSDSNGMAFESPLSHGVTTWWSDTYGEGPRMFYHALAAIPEWSPPHEDHILYSANILNHVVYGKNQISYFSPDEGTEYLKLSYQPKRVLLNSSPLSPVPELKKNGYLIKSLENGDYYIIVNHQSPGTVLIK